MQEIIIHSFESGQRLDKYIKKYLKNAPDSFIYKMIRKKNIVLNGKKCTGKEILSEQDQVKLFLADETIHKFAGTDDACLTDIPTLRFPLDVIYEDDCILLVNKPGGILSQKSEPGDYSMVEAVQAYLYGSEQWSPKDSRTFRPALCNRLDRNTSGILIAGKTTEGLQGMASMLKERLFCKYYLCLVRGKVTEPSHMKGYLTKDREQNMSSVSEEGDQMIETAYTPLAWSSDMTLLKVHLLTGRSHQIRAHLSSIDHPILGDPKYGDRAWNNDYFILYRLNYQLLHAYELRMPDEMPDRFLGLSGKCFRARVPEVFYKILKEHKWQHGTREALEVLH